MKKIVTILVFITSIGYMSAQKYVEVLKKGVCNCIEENQPNINFNNMMTVCFGPQMLEDLISDARKKGELEMSLDSIQKLDYLSNEKLGMRIISDLIIECDAMFKVLDDMREMMRTEKRAQKSKQHLDSINKLELTEKSELFERGMLNFSYDELDKGIQDLKASLNDSKDDGKTYFAIGWSYEKKKEYKKALEFYDKATEIIGEAEVRLFINAVAAKIKQEEQ